jgi:hypothetical protein
MKICLVSNFYPPLAQSGPEIYIDRLARALIQENKVVVVTTDPGFRWAARREITPDGVIVYRLAPFFRAFDLYHPQVAATMSNIIKRERPDLVHVHNWMGLSLAAVLSGIPTSAPHIPVAMTLHDSRLLSGWFLTHINRELVNRVGLVISPSHDVLDKHLQRGFFRRATQQVLPFGDMRFHAARLVEAYQRLLITDRLRPFDQRVA